MKSNLYRLTNGFATGSGLPVAFTAATLIETPKAVYVYGHGSSDPMGACARCGRALTHPGSILIGIGPECLDDWGARDHRRENLSESDIAYLKSLITDRKVDGWVPKSCIQTIDPVEEEILIPPDHPMLKPKTTGAKARTAELVQFQSDMSNAIKIIFPYSPDDVTRVKSLPGRRFHNEGASKYWTCPCSIKSIESLIEWGFQLSSELQDLLIEYKTPPAEIAEGDKIPGLKMDLFPYQQKGVQFIESRKGNALVADEMGLGKTAQALAWLQLHPEKRPAIIVVPASLKLNWLKEAGMWMSNPKVQILSGTATNVPIIGEIIIINYDILRNKFEKYTDPVTRKRKEREIPYSGWVDFLKEIKPKCVIIDEVHYAKNQASHQTKAIRKLCKGIPHLIALSGTPIINRPVEAFTVLNMLDPVNYPSFWKFAMRYCGARNNGFGWDFPGASNTDELHHNLTSTVMIRRMKSEVLTDLPAKIRSFTPIELKSEKNYRKAEKGFISYIKKINNELVEKRADPAEVLAQIALLKQIAISEKMPAAIEWIQNFIEVDGKLVVFANHKFVIDLLMDTFKDVAVKIDGSVHPDKRQGIVERFQSDDKIRLFVGNIKAAGVGITLTAASTVAFIELDWSTGAHIQAEDRCHRIGQKNTVNIYYLIAPNTIEARILDLLDKKAAIVNQVLDGAKEEDVNVFQELINSYKN